MKRTGDADRGQAVRRRDFRRSPRGLEFEVEGLRRVPPALLDAVREVAPDIFDVVSDGELEQFILARVVGVIASADQLALAIVLAACAP